MNCRDLLNGISDYLDDELRREICQELEAHLVECPDCKVYVDTMKGTVALVRDLGNGRCEEAMVVRLRSRILNRIDPTRRHP
jgi:anti-sigma factor (TIGR02949 family)